MSQQQDSGMFGDDINSTPISKLQQIPMMTSKSDAGMAPVEPPIYNPTVEVQQPQKRVTFVEEEDDDDVYHEKRAKKERRRHRHREKQQWAPQYYPQLQVAPPVPQQPIQEKKTKKIFEMLHVYGHRLVVFVLFMAVLWYYRKLATFPYIGSDDGYVNVIGSLGLSIAASGIYGIIESLMD